MNKEILKKELKIRSIKMIDLGFISLIYFIIGIIGAKLFDQGYNLFLGKFEEEKEKKKSQIKLFIEICVHFSFIGIFIYIARNIAGLIPFPLDGVAGFEHRRMKELSGGTHLVLGFTFLFFQTNLRNKIGLFYNRL
jgi:hypothetical protein